MWIISEKYGIFNTDNISRIQPPDDVSDPTLVIAYDSGHGFRVTEGIDNYWKIEDAILCGVSIIRVP